MLPLKPGGGLNDKEGEDSKIWERNSATKSKELAAFTAAEAARRALLNPNCNKLRLPEDKYEQWKTFIIQFDPKDML